MLYLVSSLSFTPFLRGRSFGRVTSVFRPPTYSLPFVDFRALRVRQSGPHEYFQVLYEKRMITSADYEILASIQRILNLQKGPTAPRLLLTEERSHM